MTKSPQRKHHVQQLIDDLLLANTTSNAQLMLLYDEIERLFQQQARMIGILKPLQEEVVRLRVVHAAALKYLDALVTQDDNAQRFLHDLSEATGVRTQSPVNDPNKTLPPAKVALPKK